MNRHSIGLKLTVTVLLILVFLSTAVTFVSVESGKKEAAGRIVENMELLTSKVLSDIDKGFAAHVKIAQAVSKVYSVNRNHLSKEDYIKIATQMVLLNPNTLGSGIWIEPYEHEAGTKFFGPYVYRVGDKIEVTYEYETEEYNYPQTEWYLNAKNLTVDPSGPLPVAWSDPYYDETSGITMITASVPIVVDGRFIGVVSADYDLTTIQKSINAVKIGEAGYALLLDSKGVLIASRPRARRTR